MECPFARRLTRWFLVMLCPLRLQLDERKADTILIQPDNLGLDGNIQLGGGACNRSFLQGHREDGAGKPALFGEQVKAGRADVLDRMADGSSALPVIRNQSGRSVTRRA